MSFGRNFTFLQIPKYATAFSLETALGKSNSVFPEFHDLPGLLISFGSDD